MRSRIKLFPPNPLFRLCFPYPNGKWMRNNFVHKVRNRYAIWGCQEHQALKYVYCRLQIFFGRERGGYLFEDCFIGERVL